LAQSGSPAFENRRDGEVLNGGNRYLNDERDAGGAAQRGLSPEAQTYAIASGLNELFLKGGGLPGHRKYRGRKSSYSVFIPVQQR
jgi:hypothetical protein